MEMGRRFYLIMQSYLKNTLKVKAPLVATADHSSSYPMLASTSLLDIVDGHTYWQHPGPRDLISDALRVDCERGGLGRLPFACAELRFARRESA